MTDSSTAPTDASQVKPPKVVTHFTRAERARERQGGAGGGAAFHAGRDRLSTAPRSDRAAGGAGGLSRARAGADPLRPDAGLAVCVLPRRRADHGGGSRADAELGSSRAAVRRRAPLELRDVRLARAGAGLRHQRLRRDGAGPVGVGREASGGELRGRRRELGFSDKERRTVALDTVRSYREAMGAFAADAQPRGLVLAPVGRGGASDLRGRRRSQAAEDARKPTSPRRAPRTACTPSRS